MTCGENDGRFLSLMEAAPRFELGNKGFADLCLTTWLYRPEGMEKKEGQGLPL